VEVLSSTSAHAQLSLEKSLTRPLEFCPRLAYRRISELYERTRPKFHLDCVFLSLTNLVDVCASFGDLLWASHMPESMMILNVDNIVLIVTVGEVACLRF
jgi:hypothetical protein